MLPTLRTPSSSRTLRPTLLLVLGLIVCAAWPVLGEDAVPVHRTGFLDSPENARDYAERLRVLPEDKQTLPESFSWVTEITYAKDQGDCGSCWAFAATGQIEAHMSIYYGTKMDLSEQQGMDCNFYGADCDGGWASAVYSVATSYGLVREEAIPYLEGGSNICGQGSCLPFAQLLDWYYVSNNVTQIKTALLDGPVCSSMQADGTLDDYTSGCLDLMVGSGTDHLVLIVGWDDRACDENGAWICKNSWGTDFGDGGLFTIQYGACNIGTNVSQIELSVPDVDMSLSGPDPEVTHYAHDSVELTWNTSGATCSTVDVWFSGEGVFDVQVADGIANTGSLTWTLPNVTTDKARFCITANGDPEDGFAITDAFDVIGHKTVYVSASGSDTYPYTTPGTAASDLTTAIESCTGRDTVMVAEGDYVGPIGIETTAWVIGGWDSAFTTRDARANPSRITSATSGVVIVGGMTDYTGLEGFEIHDCWGTIASTPAFGRHGAGIWVTNASPVIRDCVFTDNVAEPFGGYGVGGAIAVFGGSPSIEDCSFTGNQADQGGAVALYDVVDASISGCVFDANLCKSSDDGQAGAAVYVETSGLNLSDNSFETNVTTYEGGALYALSSDLTLDGNVFDGNAAQNAGGALYVSGGSLDLCGGRLDGNESLGGRAGAILASGVDIGVRNASFSANHAVSYGPAIALENLCTVVVENCAFTGHLLDSGVTGAILMMGGESLLFRNNVMADNTCGGLTGSATTVVLDYNVTSNNAFDYSGFSAGANDQQADPLFLDAASGDYSLALHSPCLDRGDPDTDCLDPDGSRNDVGPCGGPDADFAAPSRITGAVLDAPGDGSLDLSWDASADPDVVEYVVYRDSADPFTPSAGAVAAVVTHPTAAWTDTDPDGGYYLIVAVDADGRVGGYSDLLETTTAVEGEDTPTVLAVSGVAPNPFNPRTTIDFAVPRDGHVSVRVHDMRGRRVRTLVDGDLTIGRHQAVWDGRDDAGAGVAAGVYLVRVTGGRETASAKVVLAK